MEIRASELNSDILRKVAGRDGRIETAAEWAKLDAADGVSDGQFNLSGITDEMRVALTAAREGGAAATVAFADNGHNDLHWDNPVVQEAYGHFLQDRWQSWRANREEADCKTMAVRLMDEFRVHYAQTTGVQLPHPLPADMQGHWHAYDRQHRGGLANAIPEDARKDYADLRHPDGSSPALLSGTNHIYGGHLTAHNVATRATHEVAERDGQPMVQATGAAIVSHGVEIPAGTRLINHDALRPGDLIIQNHAVDEGQRQDNRYDHFMQVLNVERDPGTNRVTRLTVIYGTYDDLNDDDHTTDAQWGRTNYYSEEHTIEFDRDGRVCDAHTPFRSDDFLTVPETRADRIAEAYSILGWGEYATSVRAWGATAHPVPAQPRR